MKVKKGAVSLQDASMQKEAKLQKIQAARIKKHKANSAKECACIAVFVSLLIALQLALAAVPGVEVVTVLFVAYAFVFGMKRGMVAATAFSFLRQIIFGFFPTVFILYLLYYNGLTAFFGYLRGRGRLGKSKLGFVVLFACIGTLCFSILDNILTPLWYGYTLKQTQIYFMASLTVVIPQLITTAFSVSLLFYPLEKVFGAVRKGL